MLDIHTHLLPGIDDGAANLQIAVELCRQLVSQGIREAVATPHWCSPRFEMGSPKIAAAWQDLTAAAAGEAPGLRLHLGAEHHLSGIQTPAAFAQSLRTLGDSRCVLIELPDDHVPANAWVCLHETIRAGYRPFIAHPERCKGLRGESAAVTRFLDLGGRLQFDLGNLLGHHGWVMRWRARRMFQHFGSRGVIASDCHNLLVRRPRWNEMPSEWRAAVPQSLDELERR